MLKNVDFDSWATALACKNIIIIRMKLYIIITLSSDTTDGGFELYLLTNEVLPFPGGPNNSTPFAGALTPWNN